MGKIIDLTGQRFGRLTVLQKAEKPIGSHSTSTFWKCKCDCGNEKLLVAMYCDKGRLNLAAVIIKRLFLVNI